MNDSDVHDVMIQAGCEWRVKQPITDYGLAEVQRARQLRWWVPAVAAAAVVACVVLAIGITTSHRQAPNSPNAVPTGLPLTVAVGSQAQATGIVTETNNTATLCGEPVSGMVAFGGRHTQTASDSCLGSEVEITGLTPASLPGWVANADGGTSGWVTVTGTWIGTSLNADQFIASATPSPQGTDYPLPCAAPKGGWKPGLINSTDQTSINSVIKSRPEVYSGQWNAFVSDGPPTAIPVVAVIEGQSAASEVAIRKVYAGNLCMVTAEHSLAERSAIVSRLMRERPNWYVQDNPIADRVVVKAPIYDTSAASILAPLGAGLVDVQTVVVNQ